MGVALVAIAIDGARGGVDALLKTKESLEAATQVLHTPHPDTGITAGGHVGVAAANGPLQAQIDLAVQRDGRLCLRHAASGHRGKKNTGMNLETHFISFKS